ncbi:hypothetical protein LTR85_001377 [Meristemomyces frigidus]|nr:hypothetical protein LTR85_001377 [Meristemomyces frigidus]
MATKHSPSLPMPRANSTEPSSSITGTFAGPQAPQDRPSSTGNFFDQKYESFLSDSTSQQPTQL